MKQETSAGYSEGLTQHKVRDIWDEVKANLARLDACAGPHDFPLSTPRKFGDHFICSLCKGRVDALWMRAYETGLRHGREHAITQAKE